MTQDVPVAQSELTEAETAPAPAPARRIAVYVIAVLALCVVAWALIEGGERDLWSQPSTIVPAIDALLGAL